MPGQPTPPLISMPFAANAGASYIQNPIPATTVDAERASFNLGFPPKTMTEIFAGGVPPYGQDMNGILYMITAHNAAAQAGQPYLFSATLATAMGGYAVGCVLGMADGSGLWINTSLGNSTDPDSGSASGWMPLYSYGFANITGLTGGVRTLTPDEYRRGVVVLSGTLTSNQQIVFPDGGIGQRSWLIVNTTTGAFTTTAKTAAGTGVTIPNGGYSAPTEVYGDGTNIYPTVAPITVPTATAPTPDTIAMRTNTGEIFATYFNSNNPIENFTISSMYADYGDGYHRKITLANMAAQISVSAFAGQVTNAQVPQSAVTQHSAAILASAALTGDPTATNAPFTDSSTRVATTYFVGGQYSIGANGYKTFPGNPELYMQWGTISFTGNGSDWMSGTFNFPTPFPNGCFVVIGNGTTRANGGGLNSGGNIDVAAFDSFSASGARWRVDTNSGNALTGSHAIKYMALGY